MAMNPKEIIEFNEKQFQNAKNAISIGKSKNDYNIIAFNYSYGFKSLLMQGLVAWRINTDSPMESFVKAVDFATEAISDLTSLGSKSIVDDFPIDTASILSFLVGKEFKMPEYNSKGIEFDRLLDFELAKSLRGNDNKVEWQKILSKQKATKRTNLCIETYSTYWELIFNNDKTKVESIVRKSEELFLKRAKDGFYTGGESTEGGGLNNNITIDYHLGAILKFIRYNGDSIHLWKWA